MLQIELEPCHRNINHAAPLTRLLFALVSADMEFVDFQPGQHKLQPTH